MAAGLGLIGRSGAGSADTLAAGAEEIAGLGKTLPPHFFSGNALPQSLVILDENGNPLP